MDFNPAELGRQAVESSLGKSQDPQINQVMDSIRTSYTTGKKFTQNPEWFTPDNGLWGNTGMRSDYRGSLEEKNYNVEEAYGKLGDGSYIARFPTYKAGRDNAEYAAANQSTSEKWLNGITKFAGQVGTGIVGGTIGVVDGIYEGIKEGSFRATYDNDFSNYLDDLNEKLDYKLPNYVSQEERDMGFFESMGTANFWAKDVLGGAAFTVSAIGSEAIWAWATGGMSLGTAAARLAPKVTRILGAEAKIAKGLKAYGEMSKAKALASQPILKTYLNAKLPTKMATAFGKAGEFANVARFTYTSAGFEAGMEARNYIREMKDNFEESFETKNGRKPSEEELQDFNNNLTSSANSLYGFNLAIVGSSNFMTIGRLFDMKSPLSASSKWANSKLFGIGVEESAGKMVAKTASKLQNVAKYSWGIGKSPLIEGVWEEGMQSVGTNTAKNWINSTYDPKYLGTTMDVGDAFTQGLSDTYGTKEGMKEVGIGMIVGLLTGTGINMKTYGSLKGELKGEEIKANQVVDFYDKYYSPNNMAETLAYSGRVQAANQSADKAAKKGDFTGGELARQSAIIAQASHALNLDYLDESMERTETGIRNIGNDVLMKEYGVDEKGAEDIKEKLVKEYKSTAKSYEKNRNYTEYILGKDFTKNEKEEFKDLGLNMSQVKDAVAYELTLGEKVHDFSNDLLTAIKQKTGETILGQEMSDTLNIEDILLKASKDTKKEATKKEKELKVLDREKETLEREYKEVEKTLFGTVDTDAKKEFLSKADGIRSRISEIDKNIESLTKEYTMLIKTANMKNPFGKNVDDVLISAQSIRNRERTLKQVRELAASFSEVDPQKGAQLQKLISEYGKSITAFKRYADLSRQLSDTTLGARGRRNIVSELGRGKNSTDITVEFLRGLSESSIERAEDTIVQGLENLEPVKEVIDNEKGAKINKPTIEEKEAKKQAEIQKVNDEYDSKISNSDTPSTSIQNIEDFNKLSKEEKDNLKKELKDRIESLPDDFFFLSHLTTSEVTLEGILKTGLNTGPSAEGTTNVNTTKEGLYNSIEALIDGKINHRGATKLVIMGFPNSINTQNLNINKYFGDIVMEHIMAVSPNDAGIRIPPSFNLATFSNGRMNLVGGNSSNSTESLEKERKAKLDAIEKKYAPKNGQTTKKEVRKKTIKETVVDMIKNSPYLLDYYGTDVPVMMTEEELDEYEDLAIRALADPKIDNKTISFKSPYTWNRLTPTTRPSLKKAEIKRLQELNERLANWRLLENVANDTGISISDMLLQDIIVNQFVDPKINSELTETEIVNISKKEPKETDSGEAIRNEEVLQVYQNVFINRNKFGTTISHLTLPGLLSRVDLADTVAFVQTEVVNNKTVTVPNTAKDISIQEVAENVKYGATFVLTFRDGNTATIIIDKGGSLTIKKGSEVEQVLREANMGYMENSFTKDSGYSPVYSNETGEIMETDFKDSSDYSPMELYNMVPGDTVTFSLDLTDEYNQKIILEYQEAIQDLEDRDVMIDQDGKMSPEVLKIEKLLSDQLKINVSDVRGRKFGDLKANYNTSQSSEFLLIREEALKIVKEKGLGTEADIDIQLPKESFIKHVFLGVPNFNMEGGTIKYFDISPKAVVDYGYIQDGKLVLKGNTKNVRKDYISNHLNKTGLPVIIFNQGKYLVAFPIQLKELASNAGDTAVQKLMETENLGSAVLEFNQTLAVNGLSPASYNLYHVGEDAQTLVDMNGNFSEPLLRAISDLNKVKQTVDVSTWMSTEHTKENLVSEASLAIDIENNPLSSPKPIINLDKMVEIKRDWYSDAIATGNLSLEKATEIFNKMMLLDEALTTQESDLSDHPLVQSLIDEYFRLNTDQQSDVDDAKNEPC
jgi:hypothetical protein